SQTWKENFRKQMKINTELAWQQFTEQGFDCYKPNGTFFVFPNLKVDDVKFTENLLQHHGVQVVEGSKFGPMGKKHVRINCATSEARLTDALNRIQNELERSNY
ncbi:MAG: aminotransferase class I/II-fold pyridoxal phosphate-dependent enzyme, partial [Candidatus Heimdallarchaeota archaeon]|nr:aminotransferase class I/II-fold pyridoxal phosphate-dependent enzyme [Candidatus Heimdallarchaeota archaeon]